MEITGPVLGISGASLLWGVLGEWRGRGGQVICHEEAANQCSVGSVGATAGLGQGGNGV